MRPTSTTTTLSVDDEASHVAGERSADDVVADHGDPVLRFAVLVQQVVGDAGVRPVHRVDQPVLGEFVLEAFLGDDDVEHQAGHRGAGGYRGGGLEDLGDRVEAALGGGAWQQRGGRIFAVLFVAGGDVGAELVFDELIEDLGHQPCCDRRSAAGA